MKNPCRLLGAAVCALGITLAGSAAAARAAVTVSSLEGSTDLAAERVDPEKECRLFYLTKGLGLQEAGLTAGEPVSTLQLFITGPDGKLIKNAQVVTTIVDHRGRQQSIRSLPCKGGYLVAIDQLAAGTYRVETEIIAKGRLFTDEFRFIKG